MTPLARKVFELFGKPESSAKSERQPAQEPARTSPSWQCPECQGLVRLEPSDEHAPTQFWTCTQCRTRGATREGTTAPVLWVRSETVQ